MSLAELTARAYIRLQLGVTVSMTKCRFDPNHSSLANYMTVLLTLHFELTSRSSTLTATKHYNSRFPQGSSHHSQQNPSGEWMCTFCHRGPTNVLIPNRYQGYPTPSPVPHSISLQQMCSLICRKQEYHSLSARTQPFVATTLLLYQTGLVG